MVDFLRNRISTVVRNGRVEDYHNAMRMVTGRSLDRSMSDLPGYEFCSSSSRICCHNHFQMAPPPQVPKFLVATRSTKCSMWSMVWTSLSSMLPTGTWTLIGLAPMWALSRPYPSTSWLSSRMPLLMIGSPPRMPTMDLLLCYLLEWLQEEGRRFQHLLQRYLDPALLPDRHPQPRRRRLRGVWGQHPHLCLP